MYIFDVSGDTEGVKFYANYCTLSIAFLDSLVSLCFYKVGDPFQDVNPSIHQSVIVPIYQCRLEL